MSFKDILATAIADQFSAGPGLGEAATFVPREGDSVECTVVFRHPRETVSMGFADVVKANPTVHVPLAQISNPRPDDAFDIDGTRWRICGAPVRPGHGHVWICDVAKAGATPE